MLKKNIWIVLFALILAVSANAALPSDPGTVNEIVDVNYNTKVYPGEDFVIRGKLVDSSSDPLEGQFCTLELRDLSALEDGRLLVERIETKEDCVIGIEDCYFVSDSGGVIWMFTNIDFKYQPGHSFQALMNCDTNTVTANFTVDSTARDLTSRSYTFLLFLRENLITILLAVIGIVVVLALFFMVVKK